MVCNIVLELFTNTIYIYSIILKYYYLNFKFNWCPILVFCQICPNLSTHKNLCTALASQGKNA